MSRKLLAIGATITLLSTTALADVPRVATDIAPVHSLVARVMDGLGAPDLVISQGASPHEYSLRPSEAGALQEAGLVFWVGEDLTPWMKDAIETLAGNAEVIGLLDSDGVTRLPFREGALFESHDHGHGHEDHDEHDHDENHGHEHDDHAHEADHGDEHDGHAHDEHGDEHDDHDDHVGGHDGHHHAEHDPHVWLSPQNAAVWLNAIAAALSAADPENAGTYYANAAAGRQELAALSDEIEATLDPVRGGKFVVFHDAYQYFESAFDFPASGAISLGDASDPSPARIAEIQGRVADEGIACVLSEPQFNPNLVATVMGGTQAKSAILDPLGTGIEPGPGLYPNLLRNLADTLADCL
ncbi:zinc ABC transporter substrate-binding protein [Roseovarius sp. CAU 1744]|uniref:zinc ABC transporter substrate-binding protein n=1 Tax=Roseovarius sp. CAU 1744 TaxID=3140368 RepID=UPI00325C0338